MREKLFSIRHHIVFALFMITHAVTCIFTNYYGDDYYYAAFLKNGWDYMVSENVFHYLYTNGRALVHLLDELLLGINFWVWRVSAVAVMGALVIVSARLAARTFRKDYDRELYKNAVIAVCALLAVTDIAILRQSIYWATGALNYLYPATLTLWYVYWLRRDFETGRGSWLLLIPAFFASATTEQASAASLLAVLWIIVTALVQKRKLRPAWFAGLALSLGGFLTLMLSPGSAMRTEYYPEFYSMPLGERLAANGPVLAAVIFGPNGMYLPIMALMAILAYKLLKHLPFLAPIPIFGIGVYCYALIRDIEIMMEWWFLVPLLASIIAVLAVAVVDYFRKGEMDNLYFLWGTAAMQCAIALTPEYGPRTLTMSVVLLAIPLARFLIEEKSHALNLMLGLIVIITLPSTVSDPFVFISAIMIGALLGFVLFDRSHDAAHILAVVVALALFITVPAGYAQNLPMLELNQKQIEEYDPASGEPLKLYYLPNHYYKYTMPYDNLYHQHVLMLLCGFPADTQVIYKFIEEEPVGPMLPQQ